MYWTGDGGGGGGEGGRQLPLEPLTVSCTLNLDFRATTPSLQAGKTLIGEITKCTSSQPCSFAPQPIVVAG